MQYFNQLQNLDFFVHELLLAHWEKMHGGLMHGFQQFSYDNKNK